MTVIFYKWKQNTTIFQTVTNKSKLQRAQHVLWYWLGVFSNRLTSWICWCVPTPVAGRVCGAVKLTGVEWPSMLWVVCEGLMMELVSEIDEHTTPPAEATAKTLFLAMFATPMRDRAAMNKRLVNKRPRYKPGANTKLNS